MKSMKKDWYKKGWTLDIQNMSWVEDTNRQVDFLIKQLQLKGTPCGAPTRTRARHPAR